MPVSVFEKFRPKAYPFVYRTTLHVEQLIGGTPTDPKVAEAWLKTKMGWEEDELIQAAVVEVMAERGITANEAIEQVNIRKHLNGFKRDKEHGLYIEGRQVKAAIKEAANVRWPEVRWGPTRKGTKSFFAEHVFVLEDRIYLGRGEADGVGQKFVHVYRGSGISYEEYCNEVELSFTVATDYAFDDEQWATLWLTGENQGIGASRSQGFGRYSVVTWELVPVPGRAKPTRS